jgi:major membrane immunogen (membrane-anchored lipoprotein)
MKALKTLMLIIAITVAVSLLSFFSWPASVKADPVQQDTTVTYANGTYEGLSQHIYKEEPYWGRVKILIRGGKMSFVSFSIRDSALHEVFDGRYEKHFDTIPEYVLQCRNDWKGVQAYPGKLLEKQDIRKVDAVSGATWSYNIFRAATDSALKKAILKQPGF